MSADLFYPRTLSDTLHDLNRDGFSRHSPELKPPPYQPKEPFRVYPHLLLGAASLDRHMTSEGWQLQRGLEHAGYTPCGRGMHYDETNCHEILNHFDPSIVVIQDKREWDGQTQSSQGDRQSRFERLEALRSAENVFKVTVLKDAHQRVEYHRQSAEEMGVHAWIIYYHPRLIHFLAPFTRPRHLIRVWHSVDTNEVPVYRAKNRRGCLVSGALSSAYPLRVRLARNFRQLSDCDVLPHPGYHARGSATPRYLHQLSRYKVAVCTSSIYGYSLRKIVEATACGCRVLTDLPLDEALPEIDGNLTRIEPHAPLKKIARLLQEMIDGYTTEQQEYYAEAAKRFYDYRACGYRLASEIERVRASYDNDQTAYRLGSVS